MHRKATKKSNYWNGMKMDFVLNMDAACRLGFRSGTCNQWEPWTLSSNFDREHEVDKRKVDS